MAIRIHTPPSFQWDGTAILLDKEKILKPGDRLARKAAEFYPQFADKRIVVDQETQGTLRHLLHVEFRAPRLIPKLIPCDNNLTTQITLI